ncbi:MAG: tetratricopeptide repeat protein [Pirellulaceae bacterium]
MGSVLGRVVWIAVVALWMVGFWRNLRQLPKLLACPPPPQSALDLFPQAQGEYLKGHWFEAESLLAKQLRTSPEDADSRLMLATLYRRTGRTPDARKELRRLERCEAAPKWRFEIEQEKQLLDQRDQREKEEQQNEQEPAESASAASSSTASVAQSSRAA